MQMMRFATSPILKFIDDRLQVGKELSDNRDHTHAAYKSWCIANDHKPMSKTKFDMALNKALPNVTVGRPGGRGEDRDRVYRGIRRRDADAAPYASRSIGEVVALAGRVAAAPAR
jgi:phage/plasmid-associated DNA primase